MDKSIFIYFSDGRGFELPAIAVVNSIIGDSQYADECVVDELLGDDDRLLKWLYSCMTWGKIKPHLQPVSEYISMTDEQYFKTARVMISG